MNPNKTKLRALLDEVLPASGEDHGPSRAQVLGMLHRERARRRRWRTGAALMAVSTLLLLPWLWKNHHSASTPLVKMAQTVSKAAPARAITIEHVNDEQLLALLHGTPAALVEWPNGDRTLLVVRH